MNADYFTFTNKVQSFYALLNEHSLIWIDRYIFLSHTEPSLFLLLKNDPRVDVDLLDDFMKDLESVLYYDTDIPLNEYDIYTKAVTHFHKTKAEISDMKRRLFRSSTIKTVKYELLNGLLSQNSEQNKKIFINCIKDFISIFNDYTGNADRVIELYREGVIYASGMHDTEPIILTDEDMFEVDNSTFDSSRFTFGDESHDETETMLRHYQVVLKELVLMLEQKILDLTDDSIDTDRTSSMPNATQKLLFIRLLQKKGLFPDKAKATRNEYMALARLTGLDYERNFKGSRNVEDKVDEIIHARKRKALTSQQIVHKLKDLKTMEAMFHALEVDDVIELIKEIVDEFETRGREFSNKA